MKQKIYVLNKFNHNLNSTQVKINKFIYKLILFYKNTYLF